MTEAFAVNADEIESALAEHYRAYLVGELELPQSLPHLDRAGVEVGLSEYTAPTADAPHLHAHSLECLFVLDGEYHVWLFDEPQARVLRRGDFLAVPAGSAYASKTASARVLFVKDPGGRDKTVLAPPGPIGSWLAVDAAAPEGSNSSTAELIDMLGVYAAEWQHRDAQWLAMSYRWFLASLLVSLLPSLWGYFQVSTELPSWLFVGAGAAMSVYFLLITLAYSARLSATGATIAKIQAQLPPNLQRTRLDEMATPLRRVTRAPIARWTPWAMFGFLLAVNIASLVNTLQ